jgi:hypothetical protein
MQRDNVIDLAQAILIILVTISSSRSATAPTAFGTALSTS